MTPDTTRLVLAGGGHANVLALRALRKYAGSGKEITLLSDGATTPYSGMLPGYIAGHYRRAQCFINLPPLAHACGAKFMDARITGIRGSELHLADGSALPFDVLSLNTGASPPQPPPVSAAACAVKPIAAFMEWLHTQDESDFRRLAVVGGGAGGIETALALAHRWRRRQPAVQLALVTRELLPQGAAAMRRTVRRLLAERGVSLHEGADATRHDGAHLHLANAESIPCDRAVYATPVAASAWFAHTGLAQDDADFLRVNAHLQSPNAPNIFISGDAASHTPPLPKAGVMAVRQGPVLAHNLPIAAGWRAGEMKEFPRSAQALFIIGNGAGNGAVASRNGITVSGKWVWRWKQHLDFKFMGKFPAAEGGDVL